MYSHLRICMCVSHTQTYGYKYSRLRICMYVSHTQTSWETGCLTSVSTCGDILWGGSKSVSTCGDILWGGSKPPHRMSPQVETLVRYPVSHDVCV